MSGGGTTGSSGYGSQSSGYGGQPSYGGGYGASTMGMVPTSGYGGGMQSYGQQGGYGSYGGGYGQAGQYNPQSMYGRGAQSMGGYGGYQQPAPFAQMAQGGSGGGNMGPPDLQATQPAQGMGRGVMTGNGAAGGNMDPSQSPAQPAPASTDLNPYGPDLSQMQGYRNPWVRPEMQGFMRPRGMGAYGGYGGYQPPQQQFAAPQAPQMAAAQAPQAAPQVQAPQAPAVQRNGYGEIMQQSPAQPMRASDMGPDQYDNSYSNRPAADVQTSWPQATPQPFETVPSTLDPGSMAALNAWMGGGSTQQLNQGNQDYLNWYRQTYPNGVPGMANYTTPTTNFLTGQR